MTSVTDRAVKEFSVGEYPSHYSMQKYRYDKQSPAKNYMEIVTDAEVKAIAYKEYPSDYG